MNHKSSNNDPGALMSPGEVRPIAEIEIGPSKHEKFLDNNYKKIAIAVVLIVIAAGAVISYRVLSDEKKMESGAALVHALNSGEGMTSESLQQVRNQHAGTNAAVSADYLKGLALWREGKADEGYAAMEQFIQNAPTDDWKAQAAAVLGCKYMKEAKNDEAVRCFETVLSCNESLYAPVALLSLGDIAREKSENDKAAAYYKEVTEKYPSSSFVRVNELTPGVSARQALLGISDPIMVAPTAEQLKDNGTSEQLLEPVIPGSFGLPGAN